MSKVKSIGGLTSTLLLLGGMGFNGLVNADGATNDTLACYSWSAFPKERINLGIRNGGPLSASTEQVTQRTRGVHGKHVGSCGKGTNASLTGVLVEIDTVGAQLGVYSAQSRGEEKFGGDDHCRSVSIECYTTETSLTPTQWTCQSRNEFGVYHGHSTLDLIAVDTSPDDPLCGVFEDKDDFEDSNKGAQGVASGLQASRENRDYR